MQACEVATSTFDFSPCLTGGVGGTLRVGGENGTDIGGTGVCNGNSKGDDGVDNCLVFLLCVVRWLIKCPFLNGLANVAMVVTFLQTLFSQT